MHKDKSNNLFWWDDKNLLLCYFKVDLNHETDDTNCKGVKENHSIISKTEEILMVLLFFAKWRKCAIWLMILSSIKYDDFAGFRIFYYI